MARGRASSSRNLALFSSKRLSLSSFIVTLPRAEMVDMARSGADG